MFHGAEANGSAQILVGFPPFLGPRQRRVQREPAAPGHVPTALGLCCFAIRSRRDADSSPVASENLVALERFGLVPIQHLQLVSGRPFWCPAPFDLCLGWLAWVCSGSSPYHIFSAIVEVHTRLPQSNAVLQTGGPLWPMGSRLQARRQPSPAVQRRRRRRPLKWKPWRAGWEYSPQIDMESCSHPSRLKASMLPIVFLEGALPG